MKVVLVTGGLGFIGSNFIRVLFEQTATYILSITGANRPPRMKGGSDGARPRPARV